MKFPYVYPDPESCRLRAALAKDSELESAYILAGCGADELIDLIMRLEINFYILYMFPNKYALFVYLPNFSIKKLLILCEIG